MAIKGEGVRSKYWGTILVTQGLLGLLIFGSKLVLGVGGRTVRLVAVGSKAEEEISLSIVEYMSCWYKRDRGGCGNRRRSSGAVSMLHLYKDSHTHHPTAALLSAGLTIMSLR